MYPILLMSHSILRYAVILLLILVLLRSLYGWLTRKTFERSDYIISRVLTSGTHLQLLLGIILFFISPLVVFSGETMKDPSMRYWTVEHWLLMLVAVLLITISSIRIKKQADSATKHRTVFLLNGLAMLIILVSLTLSGRGII
jgi:uncharacterized membrane protein